LVARRILHQDAELPRPSRDLLKAAAKTGYLAMAASMHLSFDAEFVDWDKLQKPYQEVWEQVAKSIYAVIAIQGGALVEEIPGTYDGDENEEEA
jgi:hypothetical protein